MTGRHRHQRAQVRRRTHPRPATLAVVALVALTVLIALRPGSSTAPRPTAAAGSPSDRPSVQQTAPSHSASRPATRARARASALGWLTPLSATSVGHLQPGSQPSALPYPVLIVDKLNNRLIVVDPQGRVRWQFPRPGDLAPGQTFHIPDDAFFTPDGRYIIATQEDEAVITVIDIRRHRIVYRYGSPGQPGMIANRLDNPDDAMMLPNGDILTPDIKNCRLLLIGAHAHVPARVYGISTNQCHHHPPTRWGSPNGAFPLADGHFLVTEINGDWVNEIGLDGTVVWSTHPPGVGYPSDTNQVGPDRYLTVDFSRPGRVVMFDHTGRNLWTFTDNGKLNHPSLALPLPNGNVIVNDDSNHRVIVIDPRTNRIVWQYGHTGVPGVNASYLNNPDGMDLLPPHSLLITHTEAMMLGTAGIAGHG